MGTPPPVLPVPAPGRRTRRAAWLALAAVAVAGGSLVTLGYRHWQSRGTTVTVHFAEVHGLRPGRKSATAA